MEEIKQIDLEQVIAETGDSKSAKLLALAKQPLKMLAQAGKDGARAVRNFLSILIMMSMTNFVVLIYVIYRFFASDAAVSSLGWILLIVVIDVLFTLLCAYRGYQYLMIEVLHQLYNSLAGAFQKLCYSISERASGIFQKGGTQQEGKLQKLVNAKELAGTYFNKAPRLLRWGLNILLSKIPMYSFLKQMDGDLRAGNIQSASDKLYSETDGWIRENVFGNNTVRWMWIMYLLNVLVALLIWYYKIEA